MATQQVRRLKQNWSLLNSISQNILLKTGDPRRRRRCKRVLPGSRTLSVRISAGSRLTRQTGCPRCPAKTEPETERD